MVLKSEVTALEHTILSEQALQAVSLRQDQQGWAVLAPKPALTYISPRHYFWQIFFSILALYHKPIGQMTAGL